MPVDVGSCYIYGLPDICRDCKSAIACGGNGEPQPGVLLAAPGRRGNRRPLTRPRGGARNSGWRRSARPYARPATGQASGSNSARSSPGVGPRRPAHRLYRSQRAPLRRRLLMQRRHARRETEHAAELLQGARRHPARERL